MNDLRVAGTHHVSALTAHTTSNLDFYVRVLGLRLVKRTVNQDDPSMYHLFYADQIGTPGSDLTFFDFPHAARWKPGANVHSSTSLRVSGPDALDFWQQRLASEGVHDLQRGSRGGRDMLDLTDPEGTVLTLVDDLGQGPRGVPRPDASVPEPFQIQGLGYATATVAHLAPTAAFLQQALGMRHDRTFNAADGTTHAFMMPGYADDDHAAPTGTKAADPAGPDREFHVTEAPDAPRARHGAGAVHHVALRVADRAALKRWQAHVEAEGYPTSGVIDRYYFQSLYITDPNGLIIELATEGPGFRSDESLDTLGQSLALPPFLEPDRARIEAQLKPLVLPVRQVAHGVGSEVVRSASASGS